jgi:hypothetical protein
MTELLSKETETELVREWMGEWALFANNFHSYFIFYLFIYWSFQLLRLHSIKWYNNYWINNLAGRGPMVQFKVYPPSYLHVVTEKIIIKNLPLRSPQRDLDPESQGYQAEILTTRPRGSIHIRWSFVRTLSRVSSLFWAVSWAFPFSLMVPSPLARFVHRQ